MALPDFLIKPALPITLGAPLLTRRMIITSEIVAWVIGILVLGVIAWIAVGITWFMVALQLPPAATGDPAPISALTVEIFVSIVRLVVHGDLPG
jgi:hypothetical protein